MATKPEIYVEDVNHKMKNLKLDPPHNTTVEYLSPAKDGGSTSDAISCISSGDVGSSTKETEMDSWASDYSTYYYNYYDPSFGTSFGEWGYPYYVVGTDGLDLQHAAAQVENGSFGYYMPGTQPGFVPYNTFAPGAVGLGAQYVDQNQYYSIPMIEQPFASGGYITPSVLCGPELFSTYQLDSTSPFMDVYGMNHFVDPNIAVPKSNSSLQNDKGSSAKSMPFSKPMALERNVSVPGVDSSSFSLVDNQAFKPANKGTPIISKGSINKSPWYNNQGNSSMFYQSHANTKEIGNPCVGYNKFKGRNKLHGMSNSCSFNELIRGPRTSALKNSMASDVDHVDSQAADGNGNASSLDTTVKKDEYNLSSFLTEYDDAFFFIIKSYSEDDVHKSIKYNVWASTPNGNKRLDNAFQAAQENMAERGSKCPVFLFFSVNASGQFCGVAEMIGCVDFSKSMDFWQQDKWNGFFPVKWHIVKDLPNPQLRHIILENNENKPVTNSRDTQEVKFPQGTGMLNIFKNYPLKTSILDDLVFYENRQKEMQTKKNKSVDSAEQDNMKDAGLKLPQTDQSESASKYPSICDGPTGGPLMENCVG